MATPVSRQITPLNRVPRANLTAAMQQGAQHLRPILEAVRDHGVAFMAIPQSRKPFGHIENRPVIAIIGDDTDIALGPSHFHAASLQRLIKSARAVSVISSDTNAPAYGMAPAAALVMGATVLLIETRIEQEDAWLECVRAAAPTMPILLCTVAGGRA